MLIHLQKFDSSLHLVLATHTVHPKLASIALQSWSNGRTGKLAKQKAAVTTFKLAVAAALSSLT